ncbi:Astra associated protein 1 Asa1 [Cladophialophora chaetospira]|uniref:ASTRA-associated protein 1 n=1 Tax=Cladophialophora chaetospira TaxID=386627 RepID=A0AA39CDM5_9EURO|nr:Astra associated protein 1 Asa1 [Cladophialophora chaetospira]
MEQGPAVPAYVLRGHEVPIHALAFYAGNTFLISGDSDGWLVIWSLSSKRPVAVWKGHEAGVLQIKDWTNHRLVSHGRDHKLRVWQVRLEDLSSLSTKLPTEASGSIADQPQPWLLHSMSVSALNFCAFSMCEEPYQEASVQDATPQVLAFPNGLDSGGIDIFQLPSEKRLSQIKSDKDSPTGMVMAISIFHQKDESSLRLVVVSGYEDGRVMIHVHQGDPSNPEQTNRWQRLMSSKPHSQPVLSLELLPSRTHFLTSSADATIAKFPLPSPSGTAAPEPQPEKSVNTKHAGQQCLSVRSDGKIFATAGWDGRVRVYSCKTLKGLAVLKWHKVGVYSTAFAIVTDSDGDGDGGRIQSNESAKTREASSDGTSMSKSTEITRGINALDLIKEQRESKARRTHWLAAGGKDGKISLWDIY